MATISRNPDRLQGADVAGRILMYTPDPVENGSSVSHWDRRATPNLLMEPALGPGPGAPSLDVTPAVMQDLGWRLGTSQVVIVPADLPNLGLNDPRPFAGAPGNPATTLGAARRVVVEAAFATWAETLESDVPIVALVRFAEFFCERNVGAILAGAGPLSAWSDLDNPAALAHTWYPAALAESLQGEDLTGPPTATGGGDITEVVNSFLDEGCLGEGRGWYYGLDNQAPANKSSLYSVLLHELEHGLGMLTFTDANSGAELNGLPGIYDRFLCDAGDITIPVIAVGRSAGARLETAACPDQAPPLAGGRFDVRAVWFTDLEAGNAQITRLTANSVYATFFDPDNPELLIKVLDACSSPESRFWVFAAGLTNVGVQLLVTDTVTGLSQGYVNRVGNSFAPVFDTSAFACEAVP